VVRTTSDAARAASRQAAGLGALATWHRTCMRTAVQEALMAPVALQIDRTAVCIPPGLRATDKDWLCLLLENPASSEVQQ
jgi:hypothetical protein